MSFLKKMIFILVGMGIVAFGGAGVREQGNAFANLGGFLSIILGGAILFVFARMAWRAVGCLVSAGVILAVVAFMFYAIGMFSDGITKTPNKVKEMIGGDVKKEAIEDKNKNPMDAVVEDFPTDKKEEPKEVSKKISPNMASNSGELSIDNLKDMFSKALSGGSIEPQKEINPNMLPSIYGSVKVLNGDTLQLNNKLVRLYAIDAPESNQLCADKFGSSYHCGAKSARWLKKWLGDNTIECKVVEQNEEGQIVGICNYGPYDIAAALVNAGWAVSYDKYATIYKPYEIQAQNNKRGLWQGRFYMPWDWRAQQSKKPDIKVLMPKKKKKPTPFSPRI